MSSPLAGKKAIFFGSKFLLEFGFGVGFFAATSLFINRVGTFDLFYIYFGSSALALVLSLLFAKVVDKYSRKLIFFSSFLAMGGVILISTFLIYRFPDWKPIFFAIRIFSYSIYVLTQLEFGVLASLSFSHAEAKPAFSRLVAITIFGHIVGGLFTQYFSEILHTENLFLMWGIIICVAPLAFIKMEFPKSQTAQFSTGVIWGEVQSPGTGLRSRSFFASHFIKLLMIFWLIYSFICNGTDYVYNTFAAATFPDADSLTAFFGRVTAIASIGGFLYHFLIGPRLLHRLNPTQNFILVALMMLIPWIIFVVSPSLLTVGILEGVIFFFVDFFAAGFYSTILTVLPERTKGRIRVLTEGIGRPLGTILLFGFAAMFAFKVSINNMNYLMLATCAIFFAYPFLFKKSYFKHLFNCLHSRDKSLVLNTVQAFGESPQKEAIQPLSLYLKERGSFDIRRAAILTLENFPNHQAIQHVLPILSNPSDPLHTVAIEGLTQCRDYQGVYILLGLVKSRKEVDPWARRKALETLKEILGKELISFLLSCLHDPELIKSPEVIEILAKYKDPKLISVFLNLLEHENPWVRAGACIGLYPFSKSPKNVREKASAEIQRLISSKQASEKSAGIYAIGTIPLGGFEKFLENSLKSPHEDVVWYTTQALAELKHPAFIQPYIKILLGQDTDRAIDAGRRIVRLPHWSRNVLFQEIFTLRDTKQMTIQDRLRKTREDFSEEFPSRSNVDIFSTFIQFS